MSDEVGPWALECRGLRRSFGRIEAVVDLDLQIGRGQFVGLIGHNGAGKSTLLRMWTGMLEPTAGSVLVGGVDVHKEPAKARRKFGAVPEQPAVYEYLTGREWLQFVAEVRGEQAEVEPLLEILGLADHAGRLIREYSQGMRRKAGLAAALIGDPSVIFLDESLNGLDPPSAARVKDVLRSRVEQGTTVLLSTHVVETVERVADRVIMLAHGRLVADEQISDLEDGGLEALFLKRLGETHAAGWEG